MSSPIERAIGIFECNLAALELRKMYYDFFPRNHRYWFRNVLRATQRLQERQVEYQRAIQELCDGQTVYAVRLLSRMAQETCPRSDGICRRMFGGGPLFRLPPPVVPSSSYDPLHSHAFTAIVQLLSELPRPKMSR